MPLQSGDWVRTEEGEVGQVVHIERMTAFVRLTTQSKDETVIGYLASKLTKIERPDELPSSTGIACMCTYFLQALSSAVA